MTIVERSKHVLLELGATPILYLMIALSIISVAIMLERAFFFTTVRENVERLAAELAARLNDNDVESARALVKASKSAEAAIVAAGLQQLQRGADAAQEAMASATAIQRMRLERRLAFLGTLGNNAPFIGLLGTVIGIVQAFEKLQNSGMGGGNGPATDVMGAIAEALVATAIGLIVAIPAVAAFNYFNRRIRATLSSSEALTHILLAYAKGQNLAAVSHSPNGPSSENPSSAPSPETEAFGLQRISSISG